MSTITYKIIVTNSRYQELLSHLQDNLVKEFTDIYGKPAFNIDYCIGNKSKETILCDITINNPQQWELLVCLQADIAANFIDIYGVSPPAINYTFWPG